MKHKITHTNDKKRKTNPYYLQCKVFIACILCILNEKYSTHLFDFIHIFFNSILFALRFPRQQVI